MFIYSIATVKAEVTTRTGLQHTHARKTTRYYFGYHFK